MQRLGWDSSGNIGSKNYICGYCGTPIASEKGWSANAKHAQIYICHVCTRPSLFDYTEGEKQFPGVVFGNPVADIPEESVALLYDEARNCTGARAYTAAVLSCRKLLMHVAVSKGAEEGESFVHYVNFLAEKHYVPPDAKEWVDHIRKKANEANHEIVIMPKEEAEELLAFCEMLLKVIYEFPSAVKKKYLNKG
jgi:hypothetical protein